MTPVTVIHGDSREKLKELEADSIDGCVTDPPYALTGHGRPHGHKLNGNGTDRTHQRNYVERAGFMGQKWDTGETAFDPSFWAEVLRVLKPGAHLLAFSGTRTYHRMVCAIEDAGFEIRDQIQWVYGSGFAKSRDPWRLEMKEKVEVALRAQGVEGEIAWK